MSAEFSSYRDSIRSSLKSWPELSWLSRFLQTPKPAGGDKTSAQVFNFIGNRFIASESNSTAASIFKATEDDTEGSLLRIVVISHGKSWDVDRDIIDAVCSRYGVDPRFIASHFDYSTIWDEENYPSDLHENQFAWNLGDDTMSPLSMQLDSCFSFAYKEQCLSVAIHEKHSRTTCKGSSSLNSIYHQ